MFKFKDKLKTFFKRSELTPEYWDDLEELLLTSDAGLLVTQKIIDAVKGGKRVDETKEKLHKVASEILKNHKI